MAVLSVLTKLPSVAPVEEVEVAAAALEVAEATTLEVEVVTAEEEVVDIVCTMPAYT